MFKIILLLSSVLGVSMMMNMSIDIPTDPTTPSEKVISAETAKEITEMNEIITLKLDKAAKLEEQAALLLKNDSTNRQGNILLEEARLQRLMTLKYKAAIACRMR